MSIKITTSQNRLNGAPANSILRPLLLVCVFIFKLVAWQKKKYFMCLCTSNPKAVRWQYCHCTITNYNKTC